MCTLVVWALFDDYISLFLDLFGVWFAVDNSVVLLVGLMFYVLILIVCRWLIVVYCCELFDLLINLVWFV